MRFIVIAVLMQATLVGQAHAGDVQSRLQDEIQAYSARDDANMLQSREEMLSRMATNRRHISRADIAQLGLRSLYEVIQIIPGIYAKRREDGVFDVYVRGVGAQDRVLLVMNEQPIHDAFSADGWWQMPADAIEFIDVFLGANQVWFGLGGFAGVVQVQIRSESGFHQRAFMSAPLGGGLSASVSMPGRVHHTATMQVDGTSGNRYDVTSDRFTGTPFAQAGQNLWVHDQQQRMFGAYQGEWKIWQELDLKLRWNFAGGVVERAPFFGVTHTADTQGKIQNSFWHASIGLGMPFGEFNNFDFALYASQYNLDALMYVAPPNYRSADRDGDGREEIFPTGVQYAEQYQAMRMGGRARGSFRLFRGNMLNMGLNADVGGVLSGSYQLNSNRRADGAVQEFGASLASLRANQPCALMSAQSDFFGACRMTIAALLQDEWQINPFVQLVAGLQVPYYSDVQFDIPDFVLPRVGVVIQPANQFTIRLFYTQAIHPQSLQLIYGQRSHALGDLSSEEVYDDTGIVEKTNHVELVLHYKTQVGLFRSDVWASTFISADSSALDGNVFGERQRLGAEIAVDGRYSAFITSRAGLSYLQTYWDGNNSVASYPQLTAFLMTRLDLKNTGYLSFWTRFVSERRNNTRNQVESMQSYQIEPWFIFDVMFGTKKFFDMLSFFVQVNHLFQTQTYDDTTRPGLLVGQIPRDKLVANIGFTVDFSTIEARRKK